jgi:hypothetical protein
MATATYIVNSPASGTTYYGSGAGLVVPNNSSSITVEVQSWSGANGTGSLVVVSNMDAIIRNVTAGTNPFSFPAGGGVNTVTIGPDTVGNGSDVYTGGTNWSGGTTPGSIVITITYTGHPYLQADIRRSGAWGGALLDVEIRRSGAWAVRQGVYVRRSGAWVQIG